MERSLGSIVAELSVTVLLSTTTGLVQSAAAASSLPLGSECWEDSECATGRCLKLVAYGPDGPTFPGTCRCNPETNAGCTEGQFCTDEPLEYDNSRDPLCVEVLDGQTDLPKGSECWQSSQCSSGSCNFQLYGEDGPDDPGTCQCIAGTNQGCEEGSGCYNFPDGPPICLDTSGLLPIGSECQRVEDCISFYCPVSVEEPPLKYCSCYPRQGVRHDCQEGTICSHRYSRQSCIEAFSLPVQSLCDDDRQCASENCYGNRRFMNPPRCRCNLTTNAGCEDGEECFNTDILFDAEDAPPACVDPTTFLPLGSKECIDNGNCASLACDFSFGCICNLDHNLGCPEGQVCVPDPSRNTYYSPPICVDEHVWLLNLVLRFFCRIGFGSFCLLEAD